MALSVIRPVTPGRRGKVVMSRSSLHKGRPIRSLVRSKRTIDGRGNSGRIAVRHRGGGHKRKYRIVDFKRIKDEVIARVVRFEYDPNRSANLALLLYADGERRYIVAPHGMEVGQEVVSGEKVPMTTGNTMPLENILVGSVVHCIELKEGKGAQLARSAGPWLSFRLWRENMLYCGCVQARSERSTADVEPPWAWWETRSIIWKSSVRPGLNATAG